MLLAKASRPTGYFLPLTFARTPLWRGPRRTEVRLSSSPSFNPHPISYSSIPFLCERGKNRHFEDRSREGGGRGCNSKFIGMFLFFGGKKGTFEARSRCIKDERRGWSARPRHSKHARWNFSCTRRPTRSVLDANKKSRLWRDKDRRILVDSPRLETFRYIYIYIHPRTISRKFLTSPVFVVCAFLNYRVCFLEFLLY